MFWGVFLTIGYTEYRAHDASTVHKICPVKCLIIELSDNSLTVTGYRLRIQSDYCVSIRPTEISHP